MMEGVSRSTLSQKLQEVKRDVLMPQMSRQGRCSIGLIVSER